MKDKKCMTNGWTIWLLLLLFIFYGLMSCSRVQYVPVESVRIDSVSIRDTIVEQQLVPYRDSVSVKDTVSYLSNAYSYSYARWTDGHLQHSLGIWPMAIIRVKVPYYIDRYVYRSEPRIEEVERQLSRWQQIKLETGGLAIGALAIMVVYMLVRLMTNKFF